MDHPDRVLTRRELHTRVWGRLDTTYRVVDAYVSRLRAKLRSAGHPGIGSVRMRGYLMLSPNGVS
jgi:DNA-binding response OmpR family regulator